MATSDRQHGPQSDALAPARPGAEPRTAMDEAKSVSSPADIVIREITSSNGIRDWVAAPYAVFEGDPNWVPPLRLQERERIDASHNPFFKFGEAAFFVAFRDGRPMGRISAQINRRHLEHYKDATGHFGFFNAIDDGTIASALVEAAGGLVARSRHETCDRPVQSLHQRGHGPSHLGLRYPSGHPFKPCAAMGGSAARGLRLSQGRRPLRVPHAALQSSPAARAAGQPRAQVRPRECAYFDMSRYAEDVALIFDIFNDAWRDNWGFVPVSEAEIAALARETRPFMKGKFGRIAEIDGVPAAMIVALPDLNDVIAGFHGRLLPFNWARLLYAIIRDQWRTARIPLLGIRKAHRGTPLSAAVLSLLVADILELGRDYDLDWVEFSWILETNRPMVALAELAAGPPCKTYRLYERDL